MMFPRRSSLDPRRFSVARAALLVGLLPKLLIPAGFMPAALADGGPIAICGGDLWFAAQHSEAAPRTTEHAPGADTGSHAHGHGAAGTKAHASTGGDATNDSPVDPGQGTPEHERHQQWERCTFGGTAASPPLVAEWNLDLRPTAAERIGLGASPRIASSLSVAYRSRAPPFQHS